MNGWWVIGICVVGYLAFLALCWAMLRCGSREDAARQEAQAQALLYPPDRERVGL